MLIEDGVKMISEAQKKIIEAEERFRHEIKNKLVAEAGQLGRNFESVEQAIESGEKKFAAKLMEFFNSSFGTWFLTSVIVTGGAGLYQNIQHHYETKKAQYDQSVKYKYEIENRLDHLEIGLRHAKTVGEAKAALQRLYTGKYPLTPELQNRALGSMYLNLYNLVSGTEQERAQQSILLIRQLEDAAILLDSQADAQPLSDADKTQFKKLIESIKELHFNKIK